MSRLMVLVACLAASLGPAGLAPAQQPPPMRPKENFRVTNVKQSEQFNLCVVVNYDGVVEKVEGRTVTLLCDRGDNKPKSRTFEAIDLLADGGILKEESRGLYAYLWSDMKKGDTVTVGTIRDEDEEKPYVVRLTIRGRVGAKVPPSHSSENSQYSQRQLDVLNLLNDINNGLDVDDADIAEWFQEPLGKLLPGQVPKPVEPGRLNAEYQKKLDAIRAKKKEAEVKAKPPEKKEDKK